MRVRPPRMALPSESSRSSSHGRSPGSRCHAAATPVPCSGSGHAGTRPPLAAQTSIVEGRNPPSAAPERDCWPTDSIPRRPARQGGTGGRMAVSRGGEGHSAAPRGATDLSRRSRSEFVKAQLALSANGVWFVFASSQTDQSTSQTPPSPDIPAIPASRRVRRCGGCGLRRAARTRGCRWGLGTAPGPSATGA